MRRFFGYIVTFVSVAIAALSCSVVNEAIKTGDPQYVYDQALMLYNNEKWDKASTLFQTCRHVYMGTPREDSLSFYNARCKFKLHNWDEAAMSLDEYPGIGGAVKKREDTHKMAEANKAFAHYRY